jgi:hypothetical protein
VVVPTAGIVFVEDGLGYDVMTVMFFLGLLATPMEQKAN